MTVSIIWSTSNGGSAITSLDHGDLLAGAVATAQEIFIEHDGTNPITDCGFYLAEKSGIYSGDASATADLAEVLSWGTATASEFFGGLQLNMDATNVYAGDWPTYSDKSGSAYNVFRTNAGDSATNKILLATTMGLTGAAGVVQVGSSPNVRFKCRIEAPTNEDTIGIRQFDQRLRYTYTS